MREINYLDANPGGKYEPYICCRCMKNSSALVNDRYCIKCFKELESLISCSLCGIEFRKLDPLINIRKQRHEEKHTRGWNYKGQANGGGNNTVGKVEWI